MMAPKSVGVTSEVRITTGIGHAGAFVQLSVAGAVVYLDAHSMAALLSALCEAELACFVKIGPEAVR
jgi:hypothetical protein